MQIPQPRCVELRRSNHAGKSEEPPGPESGAGLGLAFGLTDVQEPSNKRTADDGPVSSRASNAWVPNLIGDAVGVGPPDRLGLIGQMGCPMARLVFLGASRRV